MNQSLLADIVRISRFDDVPDDFLFFGERDLPDFPRVDLMAHNLNFDLINCLLYFIDKIFYLMTAKSPTYKLERKLSVEKVFEPEDQPYQFPHESPTIPHFFTERKINFHSSKHGFHNDERHGRGKLPIGLKLRLEDPLSVLDEHQRLEYSSTDQLSDISHTLAGLGARSGHSFEKEKIEFSLSSEVLDTQHENMLLKKKMNEMKKQLKYLRDHDEKMFGQIMQYKERADKAETALMTLRQQVQSQKEKVTAMEKELEGRELRIEELQRLLAHNQRRKTDGKVSIMVQEAENYKELISQYEDEIHRQKDHFTQEMAQTHNHYQALIQEMSKQFEMAKIIGQNQINELLLKLKKRDNEIGCLRNRLAHFEFNSKMSTLVSDHISNSKDHNKDFHQYRTPTQYAQRFAKFSQFIDERIHKSCEKDRNQRQERVIKSAVDKPQFQTNLNGFRQKMPESQNGEVLKISQLLQKNARFNKRTNQLWENA